MVCMTAANVHCIHYPIVLVPTRSYMKDYTSRSNDVYTFVSWDGTTLVPPFSCAYNNGMHLLKTSNAPGSKANGKVSQ